MVPLVNAGSPFRDSSEESRPSEMPPPVDEGINAVGGEVKGYVSALGFGEGAVFGISGVAKARFEDEASIAVGDGLVFSLDKDESGDGNFTTTSR